MAEEKPRLAFIVVEEVTEKTGLRSVELKVEPGEGVEPTADCVQTAHFIVQLVHDYQAAKIREMEGAH